tara:strand:- start:925 stop:1296 length:372 start_codon:yes stop_codon:yes gene_type:complete
MKEYSKLFKSNKNDIIGNLSFDNMVSVNGGRYKIKNLFKYLKKNDFDVTGYWIREKTKIKNTHYHFVLKLENNRDKNILKNMIFKYWKWNGSVMVKDYDKKIGSFENYMSKSMSYNDFDWDFI